MAETNPIVAQTGLRSYEDYLAESRKPNQNLGQTDFLNLLASQLKYQDPMEPMKDTDFIAQMAQFSSLQLMEGMTTSMNALQYNSLVGKYVYAEVSMPDGTNVAVEGVVQGVIQQEGKTYIQLPGYSYLIEASKVTEIYDRDAVLGMGGGSLLQTASLIGRQVVAKVFDSEGNEQPDVSGVVTRIAMEQGTMVAYLDGSSDKKVLVSNIVDIGQVLDDTNVSDGDDTTVDPGENDDTNVTEEETP